MNSKIAFIIFIIAASTLFPAVGYYLDYRAHKMPRKKKGTAANEDATK